MNFVGSLSGHTEYFDESLEKQYFFKSWYKTLGFFFWLTLLIAPTATPPENVSALVLSSGQADHDIFF